MANSSDENIYAKIKMGFYNTETTVVHATEPSLVLGHDNKSLYTLCNSTNRENNLEEAKSEKLDINLKPCLTLWAESLGTRTSMGKLLLDWMKRRGLKE